MKKILLGSYHGKTRYAIVDDDNYDELKKFKWWAHYGTTGNTIYAIRSKKHGVVFMHHLITGIPPDGMETDHINRNGLDNRISNLRFATKSQNKANRIFKNKTGYRGVKKVGNRFRAMICHKRKQRHLGYFDTAKEAALAYDKRAREIYGDFAILNFILLWGGQGNKGRTMQKNIFEQCLAIFENNC